MSGCLEAEPGSDVNFQDVWQAIEKVLLEDSLSSKSPDTERPQFTELSPAKEFPGPTSVSKSGSVLTELSSVPPAPHP